MDKRFDAIVIGSGMGSLSAASLMAKEGLKVLILEQNYLPGGCTSSYWRKGFVFESGATTLVGLDKHMPLRYLLDQTGIELPARPLALPMQVHLSNGIIINKFNDLEQWIKEAERVFGPQGQRPFWEACYKISQFVWKTSIKQRTFPLKKLSDLLGAAKNVSVDQVRHIPYAFYSVERMLRKFGLWQHKTFVQYVNEQLLITAQNHASQVNMLFGATALCYTNYGNYYVDGGLLNLVNPFVQYVEAQGGAVHLREGVRQVQYKQGAYHVHSTKDQHYTSRYLVSGVPLNNTLELYNNGYAKRMQKQLLESPQLNSAFQMGIGYTPHRQYESIHHQIHLKAPLPETGSASIFLSLSHEADATRADVPGQRVASISTHLPDPENRMVNSEVVEQAILDTLEAHNFIKQENVVYSHSSGARSWQKWTRRAWGFVGGYPQYFNIKPWQMVEARLDGKGAYLVGDTAYPGQGIPGTALSGIVAFAKFKNDWL